MDNELLEMLTIDDIKGNARDIADVIGVDAFVKLVAAYGGTDHLYVPEATALVIPVRDKLIRREFDGGNYIALASKWGLTVRHVREIVKQQAKEFRVKPMDGQTTLFQ